MHKEDKLALRYIKAKKLPTRHAMHYSEQFGWCNRSGGMRIDYFHPEVGFKEFTRRGVFDLKDIFAYPSIAKELKMPYEIVFVDGIAPDPLVAKGLKQLKIRFEVWGG